MDSVTINRRGLAPLQPDLDRIDRIRSVRDLIDAVASFNRRGQVTVLAFGVEQDEKNSGRWILSLSPSGSAMGKADYAPTTDPQRARVQAAYHEYLFKTLRRLERDSGQARKRAEAVYELEARLAAAFQPGRDSTIAVAELGGLAPTIAWSRYLRQIGAASVDSVHMRNPAFYRALDSLLRSTPLTTWKDYLRWWLIKKSAIFLDDEAFGDRFALDRAVFGIVRPPPRWQRVLNQERNYYLAQPLARLYVDAYVPERVNARHQAVAEAFRAAFRDRIERLDWMGDSTKKSALLKLARLKITIGYPDGWMDFSTMPLRRDAYVFNALRAGRWFNDLAMKRLGQPVDRRTASAPRGGPFSNEGYSFSNNEVVFRPGPIVMVPGWRDDELDDAVLYGATFLGHEISHAFDSEGRRFDSDGNKVEWWTARDDSAFQARAQVLIDEYNAFTPLEGQHVNGRTSLAENMADLVGLRVALDAFKKSEQFRKNETIGGFTPLQRFFLAHAYGNMVQERREALSSMLRGGAYAPFRERVNGVLMNIPEFYEAFGVRPGDRMYRPENARVKLW